MSSNAANAHCFEFSAVAPIQPSGAKVAAADSSARVNELLSRPFSALSPIRPPLPAGDAAVDALEHLLDRFKQRAVASTAVVVLHVLLGAVLSSEWRGSQPLTAPIPLQVRMVEQAVALDSPTPPPPVQFEQPRIDPVLPDMPLIAATPTSKAITVPIAPPSPAANNVPAPEVTLPRFDADYLSNPAPMYPAISRRLREQGTVVLRVRVTEEGLAASVQVDRTSGSSRLDTAAVDAVERWRFVPARRGDEAVEAWVLVPIEFGLRRSQR